MAPWANGRRHDHRLADGERITPRRGRSRRKRDHRRRLLHNFRELRRGASGEVCIAAIDGLDHIIAEGQRVGCERRPATAAEGSRPQRRDRAPLTSSKVTVPVGVPLPGAFALTEATKVTDWPKEAGFGKPVTTVVVPAALTTWDSGVVVVLPAKSALATKLAVSESVPVGSFEVFNCAVPLAKTCAAPSSVVPL